VAEQVILNVVLVDLVTVNLYVCYSQLIDSLFVTLNIVGVVIVVGVVAAVVLVVVCGGTPRMSR